MPIVQKDVPTAPPTPRAPQPFVNVLQNRLRANRPPVEAHDVPLYGLHPQELRNAHHRRSPRSMRRPHKAHRLSCQVFYQLGASRKLFADHVSRLPRQPWMLPVSYTHLYQKAAVEWLAGEVLRLRDLDEVEVLRLRDLDEADVLRLRDLDEIEVLRLRDLAEAEVLRLRDLAEAEVLRLSLIHI